MRFPFTFMGITAVALGVWVLVYLFAPHRLDAGSRLIAIAGEVILFGFGGFVLVRRLIRGREL